MRLLLAAVLAFWAITSHGAAADVQALIAEGKLQPALDQVEGDLAKNSSDVTLQFLKGLVLTRMNRLDQAAGIFKHITEEHPELPEPYNNLAVVHAARGDFDAAQEALRKAINTHPSYATAHENLGDIYAKMASQAYNHALQLDEANTSAKAKLALIGDLFPAPRQIIPTADSQATAAAEPAPEPNISGGVVAAAPGQLPPAAPEPVPKAKPVTEVVPAQTANASSAPAPVPEPESESEPAPAPEAVPVEAAASVEADLRDAIESWARIWSARDVDAYLAAYGAEFVPADGVDRAQWEQTRRARLSQAKFIKVSVSDMKIMQHGPEHAQVSFRQHFQSDAFNDEVSKTVIMKKSGMDWKIVEEAVH